MVRFQTTVDDWFLPRIATNLNKSDIEYPFHQSCIVHGNLCTEVYLGSIPHTIHYKCCADLPQYCVCVDVGLRDRLDVMDSAPVRRPRGSYPRALLSTHGHGGFMSAIRPPRMSPDTP